jgi:hypothetical protein
MRGCTPTTTIADDRQRGLVAHSFGAAVNGGLRPSAGPRGGV